MVVFRSRTKEKVMLSVKHITLSGCEFIYPCFSAEFRPAASKSPDPTCPAPRDSVIAFTDGHYVVAEFSDGTVFVMNESGKTISRYDLGASEVCLQTSAQDTRRQIKAYAVGGREPIAVFSGG